MKYTFTLLILVSLLTPIKAQDDIWVLDSIYAYKFTADNWQLQSRSKSLAHNENGAITTTINHFWNEFSSSWVNKDSITISYYESGIQNEYLKVPWDKSTEEWGDTSFFTKNDESGNQIKIIERNWSYDLSEFNWFLKRLRTFNPNNKLTETVWQNWNHQTNEWVDEFLFIQEYDMDGLLIKTLGHTRSAVLNTWVNTSQTLYFYNNEDRLSQSYSQSRINEVSPWKNSESLLYTYEEQSQHVIKQKWDVDLDDWVNESQGLYSYDANGNLLEFISHSWINLLENWVNVQLYTATYDENDLMIEELWQVHNYETNGWKNSVKKEYFWSNLSVNKTTDPSLIDIQAYPNPVSKYIQLSGEIILNNNRIEIYASSGILVHQGRINNQNKVNVDFLSSGTYFLKIQTENDWITKKIYKN